MVRAAGPETRAMTETPVPLIPDDIRDALLAQGAAAEEGDPVPVLKLFNPVGPGTWLITEMDADGDRMFGLCDLDMGCPELGYVSLGEITSVRLPFGLTIERDHFFRGRVPLSRWADLARQTGSIRGAQEIVRLLPPSADGPA
jgi:hypothetical protein